MTSWDRVEGLLGHDTLDYLAGCTVGIVGLGSGGGFVAESLAMSGVGGFVLVDDEDIEPENIVRHVADLRDLGRPKVEALADLIRARNPQARVHAIKGRAEDYLDALQGVAVLVCGVDNEQSKYRLNEFSLAHGLTTVYAGVYEKGEGGDVVVIHPLHGDEPCYACWAAELREGMASASAGQELDYGMIGPDGTLKAEPGLWLHVVRVASVQADLALNDLLRGTGQAVTMPGNTVILANRALEIFEGALTLPYSAEWVNVPRDPDCLVCGRLKRLTDSAEAAASDEALSLDQLMADSGLSYDEAQDSK